MMNRIKRGPVPTKAFQAIIRYIFDDGETIKEEYMDHDECRVVQIAELSHQDVHDLHKTIMDSGLDVGELHGVLISQLAGVWMMDATRSNSNGLYWDQVYEICKCHEVTETITVTKWKPIDAEQASTESVPAQPASQK